MSGVRADMEVTTDTKMTLGVNWAMLGSERDGDRQRGGEKERRRERESLED